MSNEISFFTNDAVAQGEKQGTANIFPP